MIILFDCNEISNRALTRAEEIKAERTRRRKQINGLICGASAMVLVIAIAIVPGALSPDIQITDGPIPLAAPLFPDESSVLYAESNREAPGEFSIPEYGSAAISADGSEVKLTLLNPESNHYWFTFEIVLEDTGETLYKSNLVAPSMCIENITLTKPLESGAHTATLIIRTYEPDNLTAIGKVNTVITIAAE